MYAAVVLQKVYQATDKIYHYIIPPGLKEKALVGMEVLVPFGKRQAKGYIVDLVKTTGFQELKELIEITSSKPLFDEESLVLARFLSDYYLSYFATALRTVIPVKKYKSQKIKAKKMLLEKPLRLNPDQKEAFQKIKESQQMISLLYGVTGSGKTEVYFHLIEEVLQEGREVIVLVPEISLTPHFIDRFQARFGEKVTLFHSRLTDKERNLSWQKMKEGSSPILLGTRSAIFAPYRNLGLIIIDEEFDNAYKNEAHPHYHAREVAFFRAKRNKAKVVIGSATPTIETFYEAKEGNYNFLKLKSRIDHRPLPPVEVVDMREERKKGVKGPLSRLLEARLSEVLLDKDKQVILFLNRRGFSPFLLCRECGEVLTCPNCAISLVFHSKEKLLRCHHCGFETPAKTTCPHCESQEFRYYGAGTQKIEKEVKAIFDGVSVLRFDRDTTFKRGSAAKILSDFEKGKAQVLIGTQILTKGIDFKRVALVGIVAADYLLKQSDFRAGEKTFQYLTQVAGRAGRHALPGEVIIQSYNPDHYAIEFAKNHDYEGFYHEEIEYRQDLSYPPYKRLVNIIFSGRDKDKTLREAERFKAVLSNLKAMGPVAAPIEKRRGEYRFNLLIKTDNLDLVRDALKRVMPDFQRVKVNLDIDPVSMS